MGGRGGGERGALIWGRMWGWELYLGGGAWAFGGVEGFWVLEGRGLGFGGGRGSPKLPAPQNQGGGVKKYFGGFVILSDPPPSPPPRVVFFGVCRKEEEENARGSLQTALQEELPGTAGGAGWGGGIWGGVRGSWKSWVILEGS